MNTLTLILTESCNLNCRYCYQIRSGERMSPETAFKAVDFLADHLSGTPVIKFYGGEPLLMYPLILKIIDYIEHKFTGQNLAPEFTITTNGILLDENKLDRLAEHRVKIYLSVDGYRPAHEAGRSQFEVVFDVLQKISHHPYHRLHTISLITPENVRHLSESFYFLMSFQPAEMIFSVQYDQPWEQDKIDLLRLQYENIYTIVQMEPASTTRIMLEGFRNRTVTPFKPLKECGAGSENLAVRPDGSLHGCVMLTPWSRQALRQGTLDQFKGLTIGNIHKTLPEKIVNSMKKLSSAKSLGSQYFKHNDNKSCARCHLFMQCSVCPAVSMIHSRDPLHIPDWVCRIQEAISV